MLPQTTVPVKRTMGEDEKKNKIIMRMPVNIQIPEINALDQMGLIT